MSTRHETLHWNCVGDVNANHENSDAELHEMSTHAETSRLLRGPALIACRCGAGAAQDKVKVGVFPVSSSLPYFVAIEQRLLQGERTSSPR